MSIVGRGRDLGVQNMTIIRVRAHLRCGESSVVGLHVKIEDAARGWIDEIGRIGVSHLPATRGPGMDDGLRTPRPTIVARAALHDGIGVRRIAGAPWTQIVGGQQIAVRSGRKGWDSVKTPAGCSLTAKSTTGPRSIRVLESARTSGRGAGTAAGHVRSTFIMAPLALRTIFLPKKRLVPD